MLILYIVLAVILLYIIFVAAPAVVFYHSTYGRRTICAPDDPQLKKPAIKAFIPRIKEEYAYLMQKEHERVSVTTPDGVELCGDYYERGSEKTALLVHGYNADPYVNLGAQARWFYDNGYNLLVIYHRGHGPSGGKRCGMGLLEWSDVLLWAEYLSKRYPERRILLYGISMGGSTVAYLSDKIDNKAVRCAVIDCGYNSPYGQMQREAKRFHMPFSLLIPYIRALAKKELGVDIRERTTEHLKNARFPILFVHGTADPTVPLSQGMENYEICGSEKEMVTVEGAEHVTSFLVDGEKVAQAYRGFIEPYMQ